MRRTALALAALAAALAVLPSAPAQADWFDWWYTPRYEAPWCSTASIGSGTIQENCQFRNFNECRRSIQGGNRGFCTQNPRYAGELPPPRHKPVKRGRRHVVR